MKQLIFCCSIAFFLFSCNNEKTEVKGAATDSVTTKPVADLPYTATYSSSFSNDVSDADLKMVLQTYADWSSGNMTGLSSSLGDTVEVDFSNGQHFKKSKADLMKMWTTSRDSLSSVKVTMEAWNKMYATDKKEGYVVTWYSETDTYKDGRVDSASYHDINQIKDGKIIWYSQFKRPKK